ncbi:hypothetical protein [Streptomyces sp. HUAS TT7]|uniref:hypothetical protein n=1 Tax=Streptomyces sp. HUAS TT7 TaxID=3447507 RepID=UPI003F656F9A
MDESRRTPSRAARSVPPPVICGFLLLLAVVFGVSYAAGSVAGPVAPGMHGGDSGTGPAGTGDGGGMVHGHGGAE